jgi:hypothetical protein
MHRKVLRGLAAAAVLTLVAVALTSSASAGLAKERPVTVSPRSTHSARPGQGPAHWYGRGGFGSWGKVSAGGGNPKGLRPAPKFLPLDLLQNPGNNEIMPTTNTHLIFWLPSGFHYNDAGGDAAYEAAMQTYFQDVGGSQILNTTTQYPGNNGTPSDTSTYVASIIDTTAFPHTGADVTNAVTQGDLNNEIFNDINAQGWSYGLSDMYFIFLPDNVVDCNNALTSCNTNAYCAYHTYGWKNGSDTPANDFIWADIPVNRGVYTSGGCGDSTVTGDNQADTTLSSVEHEMMEAITDPRLNAWQDSTGGAGENGDKCNRNMGVANGSSTTVNNFLGSGFGDFFRIQREWSNAAALGGPAQNGCAASYTSSGSHVEVPSPSGGDVTASVAEATIPGNNGDVLHYHVSFHNPSNQDDALTISDTASYASGVGGPGSVSLGNLSPHLTANGNLTASVTGGPLLAGTVLTSTFTSHFDDSTGTAAPTIDRTATTTVVNTPPTLTVPGSQSQDYHDPLSFGISASDPDAGDTVSLGVSGLPAGLNFTDNGDRTGSVSGTITAPPGVYNAIFTADDHHHLTVATASVQITVTKEETTTTYTGPTVVAQGFPVTLKARLLEDGTTAPVPSGQTVTLSIGGQSCPATVDPSGNAQCTVGSVSAPLGTSVPLGASFAGDTDYLSSSDNSQTAIVFAFPASGDFVLGDVSVATADPSTILTWWSSDWSKVNSLVGGAAPASMKGFADNLSPASPPACGGTFTTRPGNSSSPPAAGSIPSYMGVLVTPFVGKSGSTLSGSVEKIVVVKTNPGYEPNPGHHGTGTYIATYCG